MSKIESPIEFHLAAKEHVLKDSFHVSLSRIQHNIIPNFSNPLYQCSSSRQHRLIRLTFKEWLVFKPIKTWLLFSFDQDVHENGQKAAGQRQTATYNNIAGRTWSWKMCQLETRCFVRWREEKGHPGCTSKLLKRAITEFCLISVDFTVNQPW